MSEVTVQVPSVLRPYSGGEAEARVTAATVGEALERLFARWPELRPRVLDESGELRPYLLLALDGKAVAGSEARLRAGDVLELIGVAGGG